MTVVSSLWVFKGCSASLLWVTQTRTWSHQQQSGYISSFHWTRSRLAPGPVVWGRNRLHITELQHEERPRKEHCMTVTCTFYSLSNEAPHEVGTVFTPVRAPERVHLEDSSRKENYRKWPNHFTDIRINACKQCRIPLLWRYHMQFLEISLYHGRKGRKEPRKI